MRKQNRKLPSHITRCLWSYDISSIDIKKDKELIITQVLNYGDWDGLKWLYENYDESEIREIVVHPGRGIWFKQVINFWCLMLKVKLPKSVREKAIFNLNLQRKCISEQFLRR